jgi:hypothetical protein
MNYALGAFMAFLFVLLVLMIYRAITGPWDEYL